MKPEKEKNKSATLSQCIKQDKFIKQGKCVEFIICLVCWIIVNWIHPFKLPISSLRMCVFN